MSQRRHIDPLALAFAGAAERYEAARPGYPSEPVDWAYAKLGLDGGSRVLDLAAGTGKLSRLLAARPGHVCAVEPLAEMRAVLTRVVPQIEALDGTAEHIPLPDASVDVVFVAEAFHWFDQSLALPEIHRVLAPGGSLVLVYGSSDWNWLEWNDAVIERLEQVQRPHVTPQNRPWTGLWREPLEMSPLYRPIRTREFRNPLDFSVGQMVALVSTWSFVAALDDAERAELLDDIETILRDAGADRFEIPGTVMVHIATTA